MGRQGQYDKGEGGKDEEGQRMIMGGFERQSGEVISPSFNLVLLIRASSRAHIPLGSKY